MKNKSDKGITLIALVITIIIMLILVAVTINIAIEGGLIGKTQDAKNAQLIAQEKEQVELAVQTAKLDSSKIELTTQNLEAELKNIFEEEYGILTEEDGWIYLGKYNSYHILKDGQIITGQQEVNYKIYGNTADLLPSEYQEVEYIECTGKQYIDTNLSMPNGFHAIITIIPTNTSKMVILGCEDNNEPHYRNYIGIYNGGLEIGYIGYSLFYNSKIISNKKYTIDVSNISNDIFCLVNDANVFEAEQNDSTRSSKNLFLFQFNASYGAYNFVGKIYTVKIYNTKTYNDLVGNFIPCYRKSDNVIGMYDTVTKMFFTNQGKGDFLKGDDVNKKYYFGDKYDDNKYLIPLKITTESGEQIVTVTLNSPLRKVEDKADYLDLKNKKVVRYIGEDNNILENPIEEEITIENLPEIKDIISIEINTEINSSRIQTVK